MDQTHRDRFHEATKKQWKYRGKNAALTISPGFLCLLVKMAPHTDSEVLLRGCDQPTATREELLRAAQAGKVEPAEELLRAEQAMKRA